MNKKLDAYSITGFNALKVYKENKRFHIDKKYNNFGDVLVSLKRVKTGFRINTKIFFRNHWYWKPIYKFRSGFMFHWLFFMIWIDAEYDDIIDKIVIDHLNNINLIDNKNEY